MRATCDTSSIKREERVKTNQIAETLNIIFIWRCRRAPRRGCLGVAAHQRVAVVQGPPRHRHRHGQPPATKALMRYRNGTGGPGRWRPGGGAKAPSAAAPSRAGSGVTAPGKTAARTQVDAQSCLCVLHFFFLLVGSSRIILRSVCS